MARTFDSNEATMRLASLTAANVSAAGPVPVPANLTLQQPAPGRWRLQDSLALAFAALAGILMGYFFM
jgi:hypothetical protein